MESDPLLPVNNLDDTPEEESRREKVARGLESKRLHQTVLLFISVDAICVLADLIYTFLSNPCSRPGEDPVWLEVFSIISLVITSLFLIEIPVAIYAFGIQYYNPFGSRLHSSLHCFDATVIVVTFVLEAVLRGKERELAGLLVILRLWRLVKLVGGVAVGAGEINEETDKQLAEAQAEVRSLRTRVQELEQEIASSKSVNNKNSRRESDS